MAKQKCGTCYFFREAGLAGSGWCHHPQRKVSSGVMIMVRRNELACRDEWSRSLWAPKQDRVEDEPRFQRPPTTGPAAPANTDELRAILGASSRDTGALDPGEDVLLSEGRIVSEIHPPPPAREQERSFPAGGFDPRAAVIRAREAYRERTRARESAARLSAGAEALAGPTDDTGDDPGQHFDGGVDGAPDAPRPDDDFWVSAEGKAADSNLNPPPMRRQQEPEAIDQPGIAPVRAPIETEEGTTSGEVSPVVIEAGSNDEWSLTEYLESEAPGAIAGTEPMAVPELALDRLNQLDNQNLPDWFRTDLPRICRTCRDYRPSVEGDRGWCANSWAFTHRRLVHEQDLAPCGSSIGDWWAPVDDVWLVAADVASHGRATPLLDRLTGRDRDHRKRS